MQGQHVRPEAREPANHLVHLAGAGQAGVDHRGTRERLVVGVELLGAYVQEAV